jgi:DEAD/DEAH box helicase domain-containing protein
MQRPTIDTVAQTLSRMPGLAVHGQSVFEPARPGRFQTGRNLPLAQPIHRYLESAFPNGLFSHQAEALRAILGGQHSVITTRTNSGKSLLFSLPAFNALHDDPDATALFLYPQKALANDQLLRLRETADHLPALAARQQQCPFLIARYDGGIGEDDRRTAREQSQILLTNPDMLHLGILPQHRAQWSRFFMNLKYVAIDECHTYRGVFGTNVAFILRRLRAICSHYGANPTFIAASATVARPQDHLSQLVGLPFTLIGSEHDGSIQGARRLWVVSGAESYVQTGNRLAVELAEQGLSVLVFCPSRVKAEQFYGRMRDADGNLPEHVAVYRAGLSPAQREAIEQGLRTGQKRLVFATSALELGIDIGALDVVVCVGLPATAMSMWQRAGRTARQGNEGAVVFIPAETPIDSYYANHPQEFFAREHEQLAMNLTNQRLACQHYACTISEAGGQEERVDPAVLGDELATIHQLHTSGQLDRDELYVDDPHSQISVRSSGSTSYSLECRGETIGEIDSFHLLLEAPRNAIYRHGGNTYRVRDVIRSQRKVRLVPDTTRNETAARISRRIGIKRVYKSWDYGALQVKTARLEVREHLVGVVEKDPLNKVVQNYSGGNSMPAHRLPTEGTVIILTDELLLPLAFEPANRLDRAIRATRQLLQSLFPTISGPCDTQDLASESQRLPTGEVAIFLYDQVYDGADLTSIAAERLLTLVERSIERVELCQCTSEYGCLRCVANPSQDDAANKLDAIALLRAIRDGLKSEPTITVQERIDWTHDARPARERVCRQCKTSVTVDARFCSNCGERLTENAA